MINTVYTGTVYSLYADILKQPHTLIAGATGSGKSVLINGLIYTALFESPADKQLILIDPKRVELYQYKPLPHTIGYASEPRQIAGIIHSAVALMEKRFIYMKNHSLKMYPGADIYLIIDEFADLMTVQRKETLKPLCRLAQLGRAAKIHLIIATQRPTRDIISGQIKTNIDSRIALRCPTAQDSRNIINCNGAELLPKYGKGIYLTPDTLQPLIIDIPMIAESEINRLIQFKTPTPKKKSIFHRRSA